MRKAAPNVARLNRDLARSIAEGHPWLYREAVTVAHALPVGSAVDVVDRRGRLLGRGLYDPESPIAVRLYTLDPSETVDETLVERRLRRALAIRKSLLSKTKSDGEATTGYRLCHGEGDHLPGVVIDLYESAAVVLFDGSAAATLREAVVATLRSLQAELGLTCIYERNQRREGGGGRLLHGALPELAGLPRGEVRIREHGMRLLVDIVNGQKTGLFLDQRENRLRVRKLAGGRSVLNGFSYTGGFSIAAALGGARRVVSVDRAAPAIETARRTFADNGLDPAGHEFLAADMFAYLGETPQRFDLVIVDPPSFAKAARDVPNALAAYRELHRLALNVVERGGLLAAASCSSHVPETDFIATLVSAGERTRRRLRILEIHGQPGDHPTLPAFPEGRYLKFVLLAVD